MHTYDNNILAGIESNFVLHDTRDLLESVNSIVQSK